jgi:hypothetical protein
MGMRSFDARRGGELECDACDPDSPLIGEERAALVRSYESLLAAVRTDEAISRE